MSASDPTDIVGTFVTPDGAVYPKQPLIWRKSNGAVNAVSGADDLIVMPEPVIVLTDAAGAISCAFITGNYTVTVQTDDGPRTFGVAVPVSAVPVDIATLQTAELVPFVGQAEAAALAASGSAAAAAASAGVAATLAGDAAASASAAASDALLTAADVVQTGIDRAAAAGSALTAGTYATAAAGNGDTYADTATGIAAVADGDVFYVPAVNEGLLIYQRNGAAADQIGSLTNRGPSPYTFNAVCNGSFDDTDAIRALHTYCNLHNIPPDYRGVSTFAIDADAQILINTDCDFNGARCNILNGVVAVPLGGILKKRAFIIADPATPLVDTGLARGDLPSGSLTKRSIAPFGDVPAGYYLLSCNYLMSNRQDDGSSPYTQSFHCGGIGQMRYPLGGDVSSCTEVTIKHRANPKSHITVGDISFNSDQFNNQALFDVQRNMVDLQNITLSDHSSIEREDVCGIITLTDVSDISLSNYVAPGRHSFVGGLQTFNNSYLLLSQGAASVTVDEMHAVSGASVIASNNINGFFLRDSHVNRMDAHTSGFNVFVENTTIYRRGIGIGWGGGTISAKSVTVINSPIISDKDAYSGNWFGSDIVVKDCADNGDSRARVFAVELNRFSPVAPGVGVGSQYDTFMPDSITVDGYTKKSSAGTPMSVLGGVCIYTNVDQATMGKVYAPSRIVVKNVWAEYSSNYRFGNMIDLRQMWPNPAGTTEIIIENCPGNATALNAFNQLGRTLNTGPHTSLSANSPTQTQAAKANVLIDNCGFIVVEMTVTNSKTAVRNSDVQRVKNSQTAGSASVKYSECRFISPILEGSETEGQIEGYAQSAFYPSVISGGDMIDEFDLLRFSRIDGLAVRSGRSPTLPATATIDSLMNGWRHPTLWAA